MSTTKRKSWPGRIFIGRDENGKQLFHWVGRFDTKRERDDAVAKARTERPWEAKSPERMTGGELADRYVARYERLVERRERKASSLDTARQSLKAFRAEFGSRELATITPMQAEDWVATVSRCDVPQVVALFNYAKRLHIVEHNPFDGLGGGRGRGRSDQAPPTLDELERLLAACDVLGPYAQQMRDLIEFASLTLMRPGELYELRHTDVDLVANRIHVARRVYRGVVDVPKNGEPKTIALVPPARAILLRQLTRTREDGLVFVGLKAGRLTPATVSKYWGLVKAGAGLDFDLYLATKHYGVHRLYKIGLSKRAIAAQAGWSERDVDMMLRVYGHTDLVALAEVDALYADLRDAPVTQEALDRP
jgi:integrase